MLARADSEICTHATTGEQSSRMLKKFVQRGHRQVETGGVTFPPAQPELSEQLFSQAGYVEDFDEPRTKMADFFSILLVRHLLVIQPNMVPEFMDHCVTDFMNDFGLCSAET